ncbi:UbiA prenyltransferase family protein [Patescibacteria group bacterium]|nr:UbiA prenyltransferase family protein [Patescibacteria group bacterium]
MKKGKIFVLLRALRVSQWMKNLVIFTAIIFSGKLFDLPTFVSTFYAFLIFCLLSSTSYVLNDIIDYPYDRKHKIKKYRPIASGEISLPQASFIVFILTLVSLILSLFFSIPFFLLSLLFIVLHFFYSLYLKKYPTIDIFTISISFMIRTFAGEIASGYHIPIWLTLTIFFVSLFMATIKRHAELVTHGAETRESLGQYKEHYLDFLTQTFAAVTILAYATYTYYATYTAGEILPEIKTRFSPFFTNYFPGFEARKWMMITIPFVVYGIARYAQLLYEKTEGERPEKLITTDIPLIVTIGLWGTIVISLIYLL